MRATTQDMTDRVKIAADRAAQGNVRSAAFVIQQDAKQSIQKAPPSAATVTKSTVKRDSQGRFLKGSGKRKRKKSRRVHSPPGSPPYTRRGLLKRAIQYAATKDTAVIGPSYSVAGTAGEPHEHGGEYKGDQFPSRSFMGPALDRNATKFGNSFAGSIGG